MVTSGCGLSGHRPYATLDADCNRAQPFRMLFRRDTIRRWVVAPSVVVGAAHEDEAIDRTPEAVAEALGGRPPGAR
jgi:glutamate-1-semialdehyde 2,1-aminomutase